MFEFDDLGSETGFQKEPKELTGFQKN